MQSETQVSHTPGPWNWERGQRHVHSDYGPVARICEDNGHCDHPTPMPFAANARLIAASPELLEALRDWLYYAENALGEFDVFSDADCDDLCLKCEATGCIQRKIRNTRAAITKATGA